MNAPASIQSEWATESSGVLIVTVSSARAGNSLSRDALIAGAAAFRDVASTPSVGAILLVGSGKNFCAGGDVPSFASAVDRPAFIADVADEFHTFVSTMAETGLPVVVAAKGWAAGAGMSLVLHADIAVAGRSSRLRPAYSAIGLTPDGGMTWTLPRAIGAARARRILLTNEVLDAQEALAIGIVGAVVDDDEVEATATSIARNIARGPRETLSATKRLLDQGAVSDLAHHLDREAASISTLAGRPVGIEGVDAFVEKRSADFAGIVEHKEA